MIKLHLYTSIIPRRWFHLFLSVSDSKASNTAAPTSKYVNVHTTNDNVRTF